MADCIYHPSCYPAMRARLYDSSAAGARLGRLAAAGLVAVVFLLLMVQACRLAPARARAEKMMAARERARKKASLLNDDDEPEWARDDYFDD